jgi:ribosomal protein L11 methyltransferase
MVLIIFVRTSAMGHYEFRIETSNEAREAVINMLNDAGCLGVVEDNDKLLAYFPDRLKIDGLTAWISAFTTTLRDAGLPGAFSFSHTHMPDCDWNETWKKNIQPIDAGERLTIIPPWDKPQDGRINLIIDPGMAFGTGHHETTKTCLGLIERLSKETPKGRFLDIGTGTGILSICAATSGFREVYAVDTDPLAVEAAEKNAGLNGLNNVTIKQGDISAAAGLYDMIAANLISEILIMIAPDIASRLEQNGTAILSGMLTGQEDGVISAMIEEGLTLNDKIIDDRWVTLTFKH